MALIGSAGPFLVEGRDSEPVALYVFDDAFIIVRLKVGFLAPRMPDFDFPEQRLTKELLRQRLPDLIEISTEAIVGARFSRLRQFFVPTPRRILSLLAPGGPIQLVPTGRLTGLGSIEALVDLMHRALGPRFFDATAFPLLGRRGRLRSKVAKAEWLEATGGSYDALTLWGRVVPKIERAFGPDDPTTLTARGRFGILGAELGDADRAVALLEPLVTAPVATLEAASLDRERLEAALAEAYAHAGRYRDAREAFARLDRDAPDHPARLAIPDTETEARLGVALELVGEERSGPELGSEAAQHLGERCLETTKHAASYRSLLHWQEEGLPPVVLQMTFVAPDRYRVVQHAVDSSGIRVYDEWIFLGSRYFVNAGFWMEDNDADGVAGVQTQFLAALPLAEVVASGAPATSWTQEGADGHYSAFELAQSPAPHALFAEDLPLRQARTVVWIDDATARIRRADIRLSMAPDARGAADVSFRLAFGDYEEPLTVGAPEAQALPPGWVRMEMDL